MIEEQLDFNLMLYFEHSSGNEPVVSLYFGSEFVPIAHAQRGVRIYFFFCLSAWQSKQIENYSKQEMYCFFKDVVNDCINGSECL